MSSILSHVKKKIFGNNGGLSHDELAEMTRRNRFSTYLPYTAYDKVDKRYVNNDDTYGMLWECSPVSFAGEKSYNTLQGIFRAGLPDGSIVQFILYADKDIKPYIRAFQNLKTRESQIVRRATEAFTKYLLEGVEGMESTAGIPLRIFRLFVAVKIPSEQKSKSKEKFNLKDIYSNIEEVLRGAQLCPQHLPPEGLIDWLRKFMNDRDFENGVTYDDTVPISEQIILAETDIEKTFSDIRVGQKIMRCVTPKSFPREVYPIQTNEIFGGVFGVESDGDQIKTPFLYTLNIVFHPLKAKIHTKCNLVLSQQGVGSFAPTLMRKKEEYMRTVDKLEKGEKYVRIIPIMWVWGKDQNHVGESVSRVKRMWESAGYIMQEDKGILPILFLSSLPFGLYDEKNNIDTLERDTIAPSDSVTTLLPIQADFAGGGKPIMLFEGRKGQMISMDIFDKVANNHNIFCCASSGSGKSFFVNYLAFNYYAANALMRIIDIGGSYKKMTKMFNARYLDFTENSDICINPFSNVEDINTDISTIAAIVLQMIYSATDMIPEATAETGMSIIKEAVMWAFKDRGQEADIDDIYEYLSRFPTHVKDNDLAGDLFKGNAVEKFKSIAHEMAYNLTEFTSRGSYGKWFNGRSTFDISKDEFVVLELEHLKPRKELFKAVVLQIINAVTQDLYLSDRSRKRCIIFDEAWQFMSGDNQMLKDVIESGYRRARKYFGSFTIITQSLLDIRQFGSIGDVIRANSAFKFYLESPDFEKARTEKMIDVDDFALRLLKSIRSVRPKYSEIWMDTPFGVGPARLTVDPYSYYCYTSSGNEIAEIEKFVDEGMGYDEAIEAMVGKYKSGKH